MKARFEERPADTKEDFTCNYDWNSYTAEDHGIWSELFERQSKMLVGRAYDEYLKSLASLGVTDKGIPDYRKMSDILGKTTGWQLVIVPGLIPPDIFLAHLAHRRFPVTYWIRKREQINYLAEPDIFHDLFGHVPMLINRVYADYMQEFGRGGIKANGLNADKYIERLYWYTVEFGLIRTPDGLRIYGSGIVSSKTESIYCLEDKRPHRLAFDLKRIMRTDYRYDKLQETYFVIDSLEQLFEATRPDFTPFYEEARVKGDIQPYVVLPGDNVITRGTVEQEKH